MGTDLFNNKATKVSSLRGSGLVRWLHRRAGDRRCFWLLCLQLYTLHLKHFTLYIWHLDTLHFSRHSLYFTLHFTLSTPLYTRHFALHNPHFIPYTLHSPLNTSLSLHSRLCTAPHSTLHGLHWYGNRGRMYKTVEITCFTKSVLRHYLRFVGRSCFFNV